MRAEPRNQRLGAKQRLFWFYIRGLRRKLRAPRRMMKMRFNATKRNQRSCIPANQTWSHRMCLP